MGCQDETLMMEQPVLTSGSLSQRLFRCLDACHQFATDLLFPWECIVCGFEGHELHGPLLYLLPS